MTNVTAEYIKQNLLSNLKTNIGFANIVNLILGILLGGTSIYGFIASKNEN